MDVVMSMLFAGLIGGVIGGFFQLLQKYWINKLPHDDKDKDLAYEPEQSRQLVLKGDLESVFREALEAIKSVKGAKINKADIEKGILQAKTGINWKTFGDRINIKIYMSRHDRVQVKVESKPWVWGTSMDYGKNFDNVEIITCHLKSRFAIYE